MNYFDFEIKMCEAKIKMYKSFVRQDSCAFLFNLSATITFCVILYFDSFNTWIWICLGSMVTSLLYAFSNRSMNKMDLELTTEYKLRLEEASVSYHENKQLKSMLQGVEK